jgi:glycerol-3-phosphate dehydrogenase
MATKADDVESGDITRSHTLLDHGRRDGVAGFLTITGGKVTTFRLMAEDVVDRMCEQLGEQRPCRTAEEALPAARELAGRMAALPPLAVQGTKRALNQVLRHRATEVLDLSFALEAASMASDDLAEAIAAFKERREPKYQGR